MNRIKYAIFSILLTSFCAYGQLSKGQGETINLASLNCDIYLPQHFKLLDNGSGVMHSATGTIVTIVKIPTEKLATARQASPISMRDMLVDSRMSNVEFKKVENTQSTQRKTKTNSQRQVFEMKYKLQSLAFERINIIIPHRKGEYLVVANYTVKYKDKIKAEIDQIIKSIQFQ